MVCAGEGDAMSAPINHGPAVTDRCRGHKNPEFNYPERFNDRVPKTIKMLCRVTVEFPIRMSTPDSVAERHAEYPAWTNRHGAVSAILPNGDKLGLMPNEFEVVEFLP